MPKKGNFLRVTEMEVNNSERIEKPPDTSAPPLAPDSVKLDDQEPFHFRPLTEEEKREFMNSLNAEGRQLLEELMGKKLVEVDFEAQPNE